MQTSLRLRPVLAVFLCSIAVFGQKQSARSGDEPLKPLAKNAPKDDPKKIANKEAANNFEKAIAPYVAQARKTLPDTKKRFQKGLKPGEVLYVTVRLYNTAGQYEQVFVEVKSWKNSTIAGLLSSEPELVKERKRGEKMSVQEKDVYDWTISKPDGTEDGNFVGKFLDTYQP